ncbi:unnamed protein product [Paramecium primaurelia]|uniref:WD domain, G-beta repeat protein n=1 Tax=Paramecium primaurelia TaxID=5886 RepID=A0A8S1L9M3_PARPR|nr:unnamed protein product [Paramecium primaurelia]
MFQSKIKVEISNLQCNKHFGNPYLQIKIDKGCNGIERLMCSECIADQRGVYNVMSIVEASERIQNLKSQQQQQIVDFIKSQKQMLEKLREKTNSLQSKIYELFSSLNQKFDDYSVELDNLVAEYNFCDLLKEINFLFESPNQIIYQQFLIDSERIQAMNRIYSSKVNNLTLTLKSIIADWNVQNEFDEKFNEISTQINDNRINKNHSILTKIQEVKQQQSCWAIAFNKSNSIMAAGCEENIKIWNFQDNKLIDSGIVLKGHSDYVQCLVFSKYHDWFVSGGLDEKIICWNQINIKKWQGNQFLNTGQGIIQCLILTPAEDQIISSHDSKIKVWNLNIECNMISFKQSLDMHKSTVQSICINENQTFLISSASDNKLILWSKKSSQEWSYQCTINKITNDCGNRVSFISNSTFVLQLEKQGILHIFNFENGEFIEKPELKVILKSEKEQDRTLLFPSIFNKKKNIFVQKHHKYVYILKKDNKNQLSINGDPISCESKFNYGTITNDGNNLIIWNLESRSFNVYQIN